MSTSSNSSSSSIYSQSPTSILGFEPLGTSPRPVVVVATQQKSLLSELLQAGELVFDDSDGSSEHYSSQCSSYSQMSQETQSSPAVMKRNYFPPLNYSPPHCLCGVGMNVLPQYHTITCPFQKVDVSMHLEKTSLKMTPYAIPQKTYYKDAKLIEGRALLQYHRQLYRMQVEAQEQVMQNVQM